MEKEYQEPEEKTPDTVEGQATVIPPDEDMLTAEAKINRTHASTPSTGPTVGEFTPPPFTGQVEEEKPEGPPDPAEHKFANPGVKDAPPHVKEEGAAFVADKLLLGYGKLKKTLAGWVVLISDSKRAKLEDDGLINQDILLPTRTGQTVTARAWIDSHNHRAQKVIDQYALTQEFYDAAKPMLVTELSKRNIALNNIQMLGVTTLMDLAQFGEALKPHFNQGRDIISGLKEATAAYRGNPNFTPAYAQQASQQSTGTVTQQPAANTPSPVSDPPPQQEMATDLTSERYPNSGSGNIADDAFDNLQNNGDAGFMHPGGPAAKLPSEFAEMEAGRHMKKPRTPGTRKRNRKKKLPPVNKQ